MCMNCGCGQPHEDHGDPANITAADLQRAGDANGQSPRETAQHILEAVELVESSGADSSGLAKPAGPSGATVDPGAHGTPGTES